MQDLGTLGGNESVAYEVSADGSVVVGFAFNAAGQRRAFRWTAADGMQDLGTLGGNESVAYGVSADGSVVVGSAVNAAGQRRAFRWTAADGMQNIGSLLPGDAAEARSVVPNGSVVVGVSSTRAFRWTVTDGMQDLGTLLFYDLSAGLDVSADGSIVVGYLIQAPISFCAFRWTPSNGKENLNRTYARLLTPFSWLASAVAISPDGRYIVGWGDSGASASLEAFLLDTGFPRRGDVDRNGCVDDADLLAVLFAFGGRGYRNEDLNWDGIIDDADLLTVLFNFGSGC